MPALHRLRTRICPSSIEAAITIKKAVKKIVWPMSLSVPRAVCAGLAWPGCRLWHTPDASAVLLQISRHVYEQRIFRQCRCEPSTARTAVRSPGSPGPTTRPWQGPGAAAAARTTTRGPPKRRPRQLASSRRTRASPPIGLVVHLLPLCGRVVGHRVLMPGRLSGGVPWSRLIVRSLSPLWGRGW